MTSNAHRRKTDFLKLTPDQKVKMRELFKDHHQAGTRKDLVAFECGNTNEQANEKTHKYPVNNVETNGEKNHEKGITKTQDNAITPKRSKGVIRITLVGSVFLSTLVFFITASCGPDINSEEDFVILSIISAVAFSIPFLMRTTIYWILDGFRSDNKNRKQGDTHA